MRIATLAIFAMVLGLMAVPLSSATVMHATINTQTNTGYVNASSNFALVLTYPENSTLSKEFNGTVIWYNATATISGNYTSEIQGDMNNENSGTGQARTMDNGTDSSDNNSHNSTIPQSAVHVVNASINYQLHVFANQTEMKVFRNLTLYLTITGITKQVGNRTVIDMSWRSFEVQGQLMSDLHGHFLFKNPYFGTTVESNFSMNTDVNQLGDLSFGHMGGMNGGMDLGEIFGGLGFHEDSYATINFHVFNRPLSGWTKVYNSAANTTTFYYNTSASLLLNESVNYNGAQYTLKVTADPSSSLTVNGYAKPTSANELAIYASPPAQISTGTLLIVGVVLVVLIGLVAAVMVARRNRH